MMLAELPSTLYVDLLVLRYSTNFAGEENMRSSCRVFIY